MCLVNDRYQITTCGPKEFLEFCVHDNQSPYNVPNYKISVLKMEKILFSETLLHVRPYSTVAQNSVTLSSES
jgi:hypothetical protein